MFENAYFGKKVLVTGNTGFKGSWLSLWLEKLGATVIGYSIDIPTTPNHFELLDLKYTTIIGDVLNFEKLDSVVKKHQPEIIFHLAAQPLVRASYANPLKTFETNGIGTATVLEVVRKNSCVTAVINITTDKVYENKEWEKPYTEDQVLNGYDPYSASKVVSEIITSSYRDSFFNLSEYGTSHATLLATARSGNVIGGGDWAMDRLIPDIVQACNKGREVEIRNPAATRPWQHVLEPLSAYLVLGAKLLQGKKEFATAWNFGPSIEKEISVQEVLLECQKVWPDLKFKFDTRKHPHEAGRLQLDSTKALTNLQWKNTWDYPLCVIKTIEWYRSYYDTKSIESINQLELYIEDAKAKGMAWLK
jgi:CDP-glucose 4,6-dehydratase